MGDKQTKPFQLAFNGFPKVAFHGSRVTSDGGLILVRELDEHLGLSHLIAQHLTDPRGTNTRLPLADLLRQSVFIVTGLRLPSRAVVRFYNKRGTAEQWIKEGKQAVKMTRLSCHRFRSNEVRLWLSVIAYNLGNLWRRLVLPKKINHWSLTSLQQRLVKTGGRLVKHARYYWLLLAEGPLTRRVFGAILRRIWALPAQDESPDHGFVEFLYALNGGSSNDLSGYSINAVTGALTPIAGSPFAAPGLVGEVGTGSQIAVNTTSRFAYVANISSVLGYSIESTTGALTPLPGSPFSTGFGTMSVVTDPRGRFLYVTASGTVSGYTINAATGSLTPVPGSPFSGPSGPFPPAVDPTGRFFYVPDFARSGNVWGFAINASTGALTPIPGSPFAAGEFPDGVTVDPTGRFAYATNSEVADNISAYTIDRRTGALAPIPGSPFPSGSGSDAPAVDPTGRFLYVPLAGASSVAGYTINIRTGALTPIAGSPFATATQPISMAVDQTGRFAYIVNQNDGGQGSVSAYSINRFSGALRPLVGSPFPAGMSSTSIAIAIKIKFDDEEFQPGTYAVTDNRSLYIDGGFYLYGDPTVRLWVYVAGNPSQQWKFTKVSGGFTMLNQGTGQYASDIGGQLVEGGLTDVWTVTRVTGGYTLKNKRTGLFLTDPAVQNDAVTLTRSGSVWQMSTPQ